MNKVKMPITLRPITLRHLKRKKKSDDFWLPGVESFPTIYNMNDLAVIIFSRYYTLCLVGMYKWTLCSLASPVDKSSVICL